MSRTRKTDGAALNYTNAGADMITGGSVVEVGALVGVAETDIPAGQIGVLDIGGVHELAKAAGALAQGDRVEYVDADANFAAAPAGNCIAAADAAAADEVALIMINA